MHSRMLFTLGFLLLATSATLAVEYKRCPDGSLCHKTGTCCLLPVGRYSCCTLTNAVCCSARSSCCPEHYICDEASNLCAPAGAVRNHSETMNATKATAATTTAPKYTVGNEELHMKCPVGDTYCFRDNSTCCRQESGSYGCCPDRDAVCCSDLVNCCPRGFACIRGTGNCVQTGSIARLVAAASARRKVVDARLEGPYIEEPLTVAAMHLQRGRMIS